MSNEIRIRLPLPVFAVLALVISPGCSSNGADLSPRSPSGTVDFIGSSVQQTVSHSICEKLVKGDPNVPVKIDCSGRKDQMLNAEVCDLPSGECDGVPQSATVLVKERGYRGALFGADKARSLPAKIRHELDGGGELCGDANKPPSKNPEDIIDFSPSKGQSPSTKFVVTDKGRRTENGSGSGTCHIVFYDAKDRFVEFLVVML